MLYFHSMFCYVTFWFNLEVFFNFHMTFLQLMWLKCSLCSKNCFLPSSRLFFSKSFFDFPWRFELSGVDCSPKPIPIIVSFQLSAAFLHQFMSFRNSTLFSPLFIVNLSRSYSFVFFCFQLEPTCTTTKNDYVATNIATTLNCYTRKHCCNEL